MLHGYPIQVIQQTLLITSFVAGTAQGIKMKDPSLADKEFILNAISAICDRIT